VKKRRREGLFDVNETFLLLTTRVTLPAQFTNSKRMERKKR